VITYEEVELDADDFDALGAASTRSAERATAAWVRLTHAC